MKTLEGANELGDSRKRRGSMSIMAEILYAAKGGALKTRIMYGANLSFTQINEYMRLLLELNLLEAVNSAEKTLYKTTEKGLQFLRGYVEIGELLRKGK